MLPGIFIRDLPLECEQYIGFTIRTHGFYPWIYVEYK